MLCEQHPYTCVPLRAMAGGPKIPEFTQNVRVSTATRIAVAEAPL